MSGLQTIIDTCSKLEFDRRRIIGQSVSRSQRIRTAERVAAQPFAIMVTPKPLFKVDQSRVLVEELFARDRFQESEIRLGSNPNLSYLVKYQGELADQATAETITINTWTTNQITLGNLPAIGGSITSSTVLFQAGDFIQPANSRYPYVVQTAILRGTGSTTTGTVNRSLITSENINVVGQTLKVGTDTSMRMIVTDIPSYQITQKNLMNFTGDFKLIEAII